ncbi:formimidoylglutamase [Maribacter sp. ANRC-HE7]|uniref:Formimidoylglutamase n=1 Tax=Maribacter aquimaris TaxID=2737171 RepID=A0ABR7V245_9FLAO|nr:formimidoylglutamase [Maribacter aquimaris]MBD0778375.1 formimidoylglutamase [Maribacter aquimaris]
MANYKKPNRNIWTGRTSDQKLYLHEKVECTDFDKISAGRTQKTIALLGYACDTGVKRNQGRIGAFAGPDAIRAQLGKMPNHMDEKSQILDCGTIECVDDDMEAAQSLLSQKVSKLLELHTFPILLGGGHDIAYGHYNGLLDHIEKDKTIGIINFDAHFDLRSNEKGNNSGTPFYQIAQDATAGKHNFKYLCLGIRKDANDRNLFETAIDFNVEFLRKKEFNMQHLDAVRQTIKDFIAGVDYIYTTIDLDGFSSAYAPGVSAASPMGFAPDIVLKSLWTIIRSKKMIGMDIAEMNPKYDRDDQTAKLAASLIQYVLHRI